MLKNLTIEGYKPFREKQEFRLAPLTLIKIFSSVLSGIKSVDLKLYEKILTQNKVTAGGLISTGSLQ